MYIVIFILLGLVGLFAVQNSASIVVHFLQWNFFLPLAMVVVFSLMVGMVLGMIYVQISVRGELRKRDEAVRDAEGARNKAQMELQLMINEQNSRQREAIEAPRQVEEGPRA